MEEVIADIEQAMTLIRRAIGNRKERKLATALLNLDNWLYDYRKKQGIEDPQIAALRKQIAEHLSRDAETAQQPDSPLS